MKRLGIVKADTWVSILNSAGGCFIVIYVACMLVAPWFQGDVSWDYVQRVWDRWQTLNAATLAFISSLIAFNISKYNVNRQREREFIAERAFLPQALSEMNQYFRASASILLDVWTQLKKDSDKRGHIQLSAPTLADGYRETIRRCVELAEPDVAEYLAGILRELQIHQARLQSLVIELATDSTYVVLPANLKSYMYSLGRIQALTNRLYGFARGQEVFNESPLEWQDFMNAYASFNWWTIVDELENFTKSRIEREPAEEV